MFLLYLLAQEKHKILLNLLENLVNVKIVKTTFTSRTNTSEFCKIIDIFGIREPENKIEQLSGQRVLNKHAKRMGLVDTASFLQYSA